MKKTLTLFAFLFVFFSYSQSPSSTKKWNEYHNRYEYFDSEGNLIGYEKYNDYKKQWEYYSENKPKSKFNRSDVELNTSLSASDIEYAKAIGLSKALKESKEITERIDYYQSIIQKKYNNLSAKIRSSSFTDEDKEKLLEEFDEKVIYADETYTDMSSHTVATNKLNFIIRSYNDLLQKYSDKTINPIIQKVVQLDAKFDSALVSKVPKGFNFHTASYDEIMQSGTYSYVIREYVSARNSFSKLMNEGNLTYEKGNSLYSKMLIEYYKISEK
ncbi:hypothetical protein ACFOWU_15925 [Epilithonimonas zeae]|uniref:DUF3829 domain-containing protein n=1 Tax=Epilithonimonas zeae TaxID=1416779 RepID=A0A1N6IBV7_9FLAO|nr:hypothetical protein [Epilithonimonas zeae]SIO29506.1 hypothetical protein SAMN05444409_2514 [Epilithonimonas zeae]